MARQDKVVWGVLLAAALALTPSARADLPGPVIDAQKRVTASLSRWDLAKQKLEATRNNAESLQHRIAALKRLRERGAAGSDAELTSLLRESVASDASLRADMKAVDASDAEVRRNVAEAFSVINARIKELKPRLYQGELETRRAIARNISELDALKKELNRVIPRLREGASVPQEWSRYEVKIDPLDGPKELQEKADFVEDTRDRFEKKRAQLAELIKEAREERALSNAAKAFQTDTRIFDEEDRSGGRVAKQNPTALSRNNDAQENAGNVQQSPAAPEASQPTDAPPQFANTDEPNVADRGGEEKTTIPVEPVRSASSNFEPGPVTREIDPNVLLNLKVEQLAGGATDLATLERLMADLEKLDRFLLLRAEELRKRGEALKSDEARALGAKP